MPSEPKIRKIKKNICRAENAELKDENEGLLRQLSDAGIERVDSSVSDTHARARTHTHAHAHTHAHTHTRTHTNTYIHTYSDIYMYA